MAGRNLYQHDISVLRDNNDDDNQRNQRELDELETSKTRRCLKKTTKFLFSHIGLVTLVVVYAMAGGFLFELLEKHQEKLYCQEAYGEYLVQVTKLKQKLVAYIQYNTTQTSSTPIVSTSTYLYEKDNATVAYTKIGSMLTEYRDFILALGTKYRYYGEDCSVTNKWTFPNSLLFAITIITTIGYGNITPMTWEGQICCICYATIGIPIFFLCLANISGVLGQMFRFLYSKILCRPCYMLKAYRARVRKTKLEEESGISTNRVNTSGWTIDDNNNDQSVKKSTNPVINGNDVEQQADQHVTVPLTITMLIIAAYIWLGSVMFNQFEEWTTTQAGYFCFITLATIGFGDFVPGQKKDDPNPGFKLILGAIYVLFGMAILAMCFDLMQEEIVAKFRWLGRKIGIIDKEEDPSINQNDKKLTDNQRPSTASSIVDQHNQTMNVNGKMFDDENENGWSTQRSLNGTRKLSPRNNIARVHPITLDSNEGTLHQRATPSKIN